MCVYVVYLPGTAVSTPLSGRSAGFFAFFFSLWRSREEIDFKAQEAVGVKGLDCMYYLCAIKSRDTAPKDNKCFFFVRGCYQQLALGRGGGEEEWRGESARMYRVLHYFSKHPTRPALPYQLLGPRHAVQYWACACIVF